MATYFHMKMKDIKNKVSKHISFKFTYFIFTTNVLKTKFFL